ncbi:MAG: dienelactone hydrolase family protein [Hyphomicrobiaceae bacterium]
MGTSITFKRPDGKDAAGYLAQAGRPDAPGVVVIQEWWGLQDQIKGICDRFARTGYHALAPDLYAGVVVPYHDREAAGKEMGSLNFLDATEQTVRGAAQLLGRTGKKVGLTGFCMGGAVTIIGACRIPELAAGVCFYGIPPEAVAKPADLKVPLQCHFANRDDWCTPEAVDKFEAALKAAGKQAEVYRYDADHGFVNEQRPDAHDRTSCETAWDRTLAFWRKHLGD